MRKLLRILMVVGLALAAAWPAAASAQVSAADGGVLAEQHGDDAQMEDEAEDGEAAEGDDEDADEADEDERPTEPADTGDGSLAGTGSGLGWILFAGLGATALIGRYAIRRR